MEPYDFEELIKRLLTKMGYEDPTVTKESNDKGVDVVAEIELGITSVKEVIQVKRRRSSNIHRPAVDKLRGSLHRFGAVRGTIITTSDFSSGTEEAAFEKGAAPITLINGEKLIDLLIEHRLGVRSETVEVLRLEPEELAVGQS
jgi:restriction system protein